MTDGLYFCSKVPCVRLRYAQPSDRRMLVSLGLLSRAASILRDRAALALSSARWSTPKRWTTPQQRCVQSSATTRSLRRFVVHLLKPTLLTVANAWHSTTSGAWLTRPSWTGNGEMSLSATKRRATADTTRRFRHVAPARQYTARVLLCCARCPLV